jgi:molybdopterin biosynthesis enzyme
VALMPVAEALGRVLADAHALPSEQAPLAEAHGRVLTADVAALRTQPPANVSAMDGYAVRAADVARMPARLKLVGEVAAGHPFEGSIGAGEAARIFTGGVVPPGADTIVIQENTEREGDTVVVATGAAKGKHVRVEGLDFARGAVLLSKGRRLTDRDLALAAAMNHPSLPVHRRPKLAVLATGDELVMPGATPGFGEIVYSNGYATMALARREGCETINLGIVPDRLEETAAAVRRARDLGADILVTSGGASVGDYDLVQKALAKEGLALSFWKVAGRHARARPPRQSGVGLCLRGAVPGAADSPALRPRRRGARARSGTARLRLAGQRRAGGLSARHTRTRTRRNSGCRAYPAAGQLDAHPAGAGRLPVDSCPARTGCQGRQPLLHPPARPLGLIF